MRQRPQHIMSYVARFCQDLRVTQQANFQALCYALWLLRTCILSRLANVMDGPQRHTHRLKRLWRLVNNPSFPASAVMDAICLHNFNTALSAGARRVVILDFTHLKDPYIALIAAVAFQGRAIPLLVWTTTSTSTALKILSSTKCSPISKASSAILYWSPTEASDTTGHCEPAGF